MSTQQTSFITLACDGPNCNKSVTFRATAEDKAKAEYDNPWMVVSMRAVAATDGRQFNYCSDVCEAEAIATGSHNKLEPKRVILGNAQQAQLAAQAAAQAAQAQAAIKAGQPVTVQTE